MLESRLEIRVEWGHCDPAQIVYNPNFFDWMERGMAALFDAAGYPFAVVLAANPRLRGTPLVHSRADFLRPAKVGDTVVVCSRIVRWGRSSFDIAHDIMLGEDKLVEAMQTRVWSGVDEAGTLRALPIPEEIRAALEAEKTVTFHIETRISGTAS